MRTATDVMDPRDQQELAQAFERAPVGQVLVVRGLGAPGVLLTGLPRLLRAGLVL